MRQTWETMTSVSAVSKRGIVKLRLVRIGPKHHRILRSEPPLCRPDTLLIEWISDAFVVHFLVYENKTADDLITKGRQEMLARIPPGVAAVDSLYPSFRQGLQGCDTKWKSYRARNSVESSLGLLAQCCFEYNKTKQ